ncbi:hypothetical protein Hanom_Chr03g00216741 [Helianthus anomalus]
MWKSIELSNWGFVPLYPSGNGNEKEGFFSLFDLGILHTLVLFGCKREREREREMKKAFGFLTSW